MILKASLPLVLVCATLLSSTAKADVDLDQMSGSDGMPPMAPLAVIEPILEEYGPHIDEASFEPLPPDEQLMVDRCTICHGLERVEGASRTWAHWQIIILRMELLHLAKLETGDRARIVAALTNKWPPQLFDHVIEAAIVGALPLGAGGAHLVFARRKRRAKALHLGNI